VVWAAGDVGGLVGGDVGGLVGGDVGGLVRGDVGGGDVGGLVCGDVGGGDEVVVVALEYRASGPTEPLRLPTVQSNPSGAWQ
jgi:hypothetical protein